ncbi:MAG: cob(I)yrinic acid a,c-diamide adenosyltransferase [Gemmatimonadales bacterium]
MKIYTRTGDAGDTQLFGGGRIPKDDPRVAAYGDVDELNAAIGIAAAAEPTDLEHELLERIQSDLLAIGALLATPDRTKVEKALRKAKVSPERIAELEQTIDRVDRELDPLTSFITPGGSPKAALLHYARTVCRRTERSVVQLSRSTQVPPEILQYLNRLSDLLFTLGRLANRMADIPDHTW